MPVYISWICFVVMLVGLLLFAWPPPMNPPRPYLHEIRREIGRIMFWTGLVFTLAPIAYHSVRIG